MTKRESKKLIIGTQVIWDNDPNDVGTVIDVGYAGVTIKWNNGQTGQIHRNDLRRVSFLVRTA